MLVILCDVIMMPLIVSFHSSFQIFCRLAGNCINLYARRMVDKLRWPSGKSVRLGSCRLEFDSELGQTNDFKIGIHSFPA